ncbi:MAG TPA: L-threonine 3-dehydrogenase [Tissierellia bacterium]|nr:L-threonine 3-dehydrogenase [Tissierellia bacterium]
MVQTMKCIVKTKAGPGNLEMWEKPIPVPGAGEVLIKVHLAAICGTDIHIKDWEEFAATRMNPPIIIGHEFCGEIVAVGNGVSEERVGQLVSAESHIACHRCSLCLDGKENLCLNTKAIGVHIDGCFAEYVKIPSENAYVCKPNIPEENNAMLEPLGVAVHAATKVNLGGKIVAVTGCGPIGLMAATVAKRLGAGKVICVEPNAYRAEAAYKMGADLVLNPIECNIVDEMRRICEGIGPDVVLEFSGNIGGIQAATKYIRPGGEIVIGGLPNHDVPLNFTEIFYRGVNLYGLSGREMYHTWKVMTGLLNSGMDVSGCISHILPMEEYNKAFELLESGQALKILLRP